MKVLIVADVREAWTEEVRRALAEIAAENDATWIPEDLYMMIREKRATFFFTEDFKGLVIVQRYQGEFSGEGVLHILAAYHPGKDPMEEYREFLDDLAVKEKCGRIEFESLRRGFERKGGWNIDRITYSRRVPNG